MFTTVKSLSTVEQQRREVQMSTEHTTYYPAWCNGQAQLQCQQEPLNGEDVVITGVAAHLNQQGEEMKREQLRFNIAQLEQLETMEPKMINLMTMCQEAIVDCSMSLDKCNAQRTGFFIATSQQLSSQTERKIVKQLLRFFEFSGPACVYTTPKTSSLIALDAAIKALKTGECEHAIVADMHEQRETCSVVFLQMKHAYGKYYAKLVHSKHQCAEEAMLNIEPQYPVGEMHSHLLRQIYAASDIDASIVQTIEKQFNECIDEVFVPATAKYTVPLFAGKQNYDVKPQQTGLFSIIKMLKEIEQGCVPANLYYQAPSYKVAQILAQQIKTVQADKTRFFGGLITLNAFGPRGENVHIMIQPNTRFILARQSEQQWAPLNTLEQTLSAEYKTQPFAGLIREGEQQPRKQWRHQVEEQLINKPQEKKFLQDLIQELEQQWDTTRSTLTAYELQQEQEQQKFILEQINQKQQPLNKNQWVQREFVTLTREQQLREFVNKQIRQEQRQHKQTLVQLIRQQLHRQFLEECIFTQGDKHQKMEHFIAQQIRRDASIVDLIKQQFEAQFPEARILEQEREQQYVMEQLISEMIKEQLISQRRFCTPLYQLISRIAREHNTYGQEQTLSEMGVSGVCLADLQEILEQHFNIQLTLKQVGQMTVCELNNLKRCEEPTFARKMMPTSTIEKLNSVDAVSKTPLFVIHPVEGQQLSAWASQMQVPVYAVHFTREAMRFETCEELARFYWSQIEQHLSVMPRIHLCALTHGAPVARLMTLTRPEQVATLSFAAQQDMHRVYISQNEKLNRQIEALCWFVQQQCGNKHTELRTFCEELLQLETKEQKINHTIRRVLISQPRFQYESSDVKQALFALLRKVNLTSQYENENKTQLLANKPILLIKSSQHEQIEQLFFDGKLQVVTVEGQDKKTLLEGQSGQQIARHMNQFFYRYL